MIKHIDTLTDVQYNAICRFCESTCIGLKAFAPLLSYGTTYNFAEFWVQTPSDFDFETTPNSITAFISKFYNDVVVSVRVDNNTELSSDLQEIEAFLSVVGYTEIVSNIPLVTDEPSGFVMQLKCGGDCYAVPTGMPVSFIENNNLKEFYELLSTNYPDHTFAGFEDFLVDLSHRVRHGTTDTLILKCDGEYVGTASALVVTDAAVLLGAISTNPKYRGRHFAHTMVKHFTDKYSDRGIYIMCKPDKLGLYEKAGFKHVDDFYRTGVFYA